MCLIYNHNTYTSSRISIRQQLVFFTVFEKNIYDFNILKIENSMYCTLFPFKCKVFTNLIFHYTFFSRKYILNNEMFILSKFIQIYRKKFLIFFPSFFVFSKDFI